MEESEKDQETTEEQPEAIVENTAGGGPTDKKPRAVITLLEFEDGTITIANSTGYAGRKFFFREPDGRQHVTDAWRLCKIMGDSLDHYKTAQKVLEMMNTQMNQAMRGSGGKIINPNSPAGKGIVH